MFGSMVWVFILSVCLLVSFCLCLCVVLLGCNLTYTHHNADFVDSLLSESTIIDG